MPDDKPLDPKDWVMVGAKPKKPHTPPTQVELDAWRKLNYYPSQEGTIHLRLITEVERLTKEVEELRKDKERLDGLVALAKKTQVTISYSFNGYVDIQLQTGQCFSSFTDLRLALDSTRAAMQQKGEE